MEALVGSPQNPRFVGVLHPPSLPRQSYPYRFCLKYWVSHHSSSKKPGLGGRWSFGAGRMINDGDFANNFSVHAVQEEEMSPSVTKKFCEPKHSAALSNETNVDLNLVHQGHQLETPLSQSCNRKVESHRFINFGSHRKHLKMHSGLPKQTNLFMLFSQRFPIVSNQQRRNVFLSVSTLYRRCIKGALCTRISGYRENEGAVQSSQHHLRSGGKRWNSALSDTAQPNDLEDETTVATDNESDDQAQYIPEEVLKAYKKFLLECGISDAGYLR